MPAPRPIAVGPRKAAAMLDMPQKDFLRLVERGALPRPKRIGDVERWSVAQIEAILSGEAMDEDEPKW